MILQVSGLSKIYQEGDRKVRVLDKLNFSVEAGESLAVVGPSGSGKTTLLSLLAGLDRPSEGRIEFKGQRIDNLSEDNLSRFRASHVGIVFQQFHLMPHLTALENVMLPLDINGHPDSVSIAQNWLARVGLTDRMDHRPNQLSGGECQRVAIARACAHGPELLLADEPSGNLDTKTGTQVMDLLFDLVKKDGVTLLLITHDLALANRCQNQLKIEGGSLQ